MSCDGFLPLPEMVVSIRPWYQEPAVWFWLGLALALIVVELWAWRAHRKTPSQWTQGKSKAFRWFRIVALGLWAVIGWHLFFERKVS